MTVRRFIIILMYINLFSAFLSAAVGQFNWVSIVCLLYLMFLMERIEDENDRD